jgi:Fur family transcriptional regulator, zinc uptake regulator
VFLGCDRPEHAHTGQFLVCNRCRRAAEIADPIFDHALRERAGSLGFLLEASVVEIKAVCAECARVIRVA